MPTARQSLVQDKRAVSTQYALLRGVPLFAALDDAAAEELCGYLHPVELKGGSNLFRVGDSGDAMYIIESGRVRITVTDADGRGDSRFARSWRFLRRDGDARWPWPF